VWHAREVVVQSRAALATERFLCGHFATRVIAVSHAVADQLDPANVVVLDEFLDPQEFRPENAGRFRDRVEIPDDALVVGAIARLDPLKGLDSLIDAFVHVRRQRPGARLVIVGGVVSGHERYREQLRERAAREGTILLDARDDIPELVADLDVLALPSIEPESYGLVVVEALASGVPVVTTNHGGPPELVARAEPGAARLVEPGDADALAAALGALLPTSSSTADRRARCRLLEVPPPRFAETFRAAVAARRSGS
jgi:glycosyltransferase involved in cell wall biosynthesis